MPPNDDGVLLPVHAGKALSDIDLHIQGDNEVNGQPCDNISDKNPIYNELTVIYWAWKNLKTLYPDVKYIGLHHYRRFFACDNHKPFDPNIFMPEQDILNYKLDAQRIISILESGRIILAKRVSFSCTLAAQYCMSHVSDNYRTIHDIIREKFPEYALSFDEAMERNNKFAPYNMFIMKWKDFEKYCEWVFSVLPLAEDDYMQNPKAEQRRFFMSERLLNVYVHKNKMRAKYFNVYYYDGGPTKKRSAFYKFRSRFALARQIWKNNAAMFILNLSLNPIRRLFKK